MSVLVQTTDWTQTVSAWSDMTMAMLTLFATLGVFYIAAQVKLQRRQMHIELENLYVQRYWTIIDRLESSEPGTAERRRAACGYLGLSEDQCDLRADDRVTDKTWAVWSAAIASQLSEPEFQEELAVADAQRYLHLRELVRVGAGYDPTPTKERKRRGLGL